MEEDKSSICERCGKKIEENFGSGRFCSRSCANTRIPSEKHRAKTSASMKGRRVGGATPQNIEKRIRKYKETISLRRQNKRYKSSTGELNVTEAFVDDYRKKHSVCEICGKKQFLNKGIEVSLCVDHRHKDNKFRGLLCYLCNRQLGWAEKNFESIQRYLSKEI